MRNFGLKVLKYLEEELLIQPNFDQKETLIIIEKILEKSFSKIHMFKPFFSKPYGIYIFGQVGSGKSLLIKAVSKVLGKKKLMLNYGDFMLALHEPKSILRKKIFNKKIILVDELQINNLADAILILNFLIEASKRRVFIIFTSNRNPKTLYNSLINKNLILKLKNHIEENFEIIEFKSKIDYRLLEEMGDFYFFSSISDNSRKQDSLIRKISGSKVLVKKRVLKNSNITFKTSEDKKIIDSSFEKICGSSFGGKEYKEIVKRFNFIIIRNIPLLQEEKKDLIARFIIFIDHIYDEKRFLSISSNYSINKIFKAKTKKFEFKRTYSRLNEMGSKKYVSNFLKTI